MGFMLQKSVHKKGKKTPVFAQMHQKSIKKHMDTQRQNILTI